jgi:hypothetical protein
MSRPRLAVLALATALAACAPLHAPGPGPQAPAAGPAAGDAVLEPFSRVEALHPDSPWATWTFHPTKRPTRYRIVEVGGERVLEAVADRSISGLRHRVDLDPRERPILEWRWRIDGTLDGADVGDRHGDDSPVRVVLAFDGDRSTLPVKEQMFFERVKLIGGHDMPYATLMYVWDNARPVESVTANAHTARVQKIVVESGPKGVRQWRSYRRDIVADYERVYGRAPGRLIAVGVISDADNTKTRARGWYGDIRLLERRP